MSNPGKSVSDRRQRRSKVSPRRHQEAGAVAGGSYDSSEFPVLLRMPDVSSAETTTGSATVADSPKGPSVEAERVSPSPVQMAESSSSPTNQVGVAGTVSTVASETTAKTNPDSVPLRERSTPRRTTETPRAAGSQTPAEAAARFWSLIPPQVAAGGMLLAVIGLCFIMLGSPGSKQPSTDTPTSNLGPQFGSSDGPVTGVAATGSESPVGDTHDSGFPSANPAAIGTPVPAPPPRIASQPKAPAFDVTPVEEPEATISSQPESQGTATWPTADSAITEPEEDPSPVTGWPEAEVLPVPAGPSINAPIESAQRAELPPLRTSQRTTPATAAPGPSAGTGSGSQLTGTIEIPPPTKLYRQ